MMTIILFKYIPIENITDDLLHTKYILNLIKKI